MIRFNSPVALLAGLMLAQAFAHADEAVTGEVDRTDPQQVLAYQGDALITQAGIDAAFSRIPEPNRLAFIRDGAKVDQLVRSLLHARIVADDARAAGFAENPLVQQRLAQAIDKELATAWVEEIARSAPGADYEAMAHEDYLANPESYSTGVKLDVSHILVGTRERPLAEAEALAAKLREELEEDPTRFDALVREHSDDPAKLSNGGRYRGMQKGQMVQPFEKAAYALETAGQITDPVETEYGYHLIRLDARHPSVVPPFEEVRDEAMSRVRAKHVDTYRTRYIQKLILDPIVFPKGSVEVMARRHFGEDLEKAPLFKEDLED